MGIKIRELLIPIRRRGIYMKKNAKRISIILMLALIFTSIEFMGVFAVDNAGDDIDANDTEQVSDVELSAQGDAVTPLAKPAKPAVRTISSYRSVVLAWDKVTTDASGAAYPEGVTVKYKVVGQQDVGPALTYHTPKNLDPLGSYTFRVVAYATDSSGRISEESEPAVVTDSPVRTCRYILKIKQGGTLKKHGGSGPKKFKLKRGMTIYADRFQTGKYIFEYKGSTFYISRTRVGKKKLEYTNKFNYSNEEATWYINDKGVSSKTAAMVWVNAYTQRSYYLIRSGGRWVCDDSWDCSTGLASTPTPTGTKGMKSIHKKVKKSNGIKWWSKFNGNAALHGRKKGKKVGKPASNGCVRNPDEKAHRIYKYAAKGSRVHIY